MKVHRNISKILAPSVTALRFKQNQSFKIPRIFLSLLLSFYTPPAPLYFLCNSKMGDVRLRQVTAHLRQVTASLRQVTANPHLMHTLTHSHNYPKLRTLIRLKLILTKIPVVKGYEGCSGDAGTAGMLHNLTGPGKLNM